MTFLNTTSNFLLDLLFPIKCLSCGKFNKEYLCDDCLKAIKFNDYHYCLFCSKPASFTKICLRCNRKRNTYLDSCLGATDYKNPLIKDLVKKYKYNFIEDINKPIGNIMSSYLEKLISINAVNLDKKTLVIAVPLHGRRLRWRGFNQADYLANHIAYRFGWSRIDNLIKRTVHTKPQAEIKKGVGSTTMRKENLKNAFTHNGTLDIKDKIIILVDDISTTGTTLNECARILKNPPSGGGAKKVIGLVFA